MLKHKFLTASITLLSAAMLTAQEQEQEKSLYIKGNALLAPIGLINIGLEKQLTSKFTMQGDVLVSPWKSFAGHEFQYYSVSLEGRYYFNEAFSHWYVGANIATSAFVLQKWNYWKDVAYINDQNEVFVKSNLYQKGISFLVGVTGGYQFKVSDRWNIDVYATIGSSTDFYKGYDRTTGQRYESAKKFNKSGEILPYRGGVMISYKLK
ncbi:MULTISPECIES: DUF3575 domain-containing protein [Chryseobacterium]|jgi:hypothetical protein|uniref:DUF3575 domain-containing protein n=1 Tax=Chryseobacterium lathyri TaxID=395933 RepID=A0A511YAF5_9FLAO|nr:DUF3575 domain-containing protein [Chryseobacterium lathyri]GEN72173.1 hypothetical protein CLA01_22450 [Chryseobacterium lathyri]